MADYRTVAASETDPMAPIVAALMKALAANPIAIAEGASGAPRIAWPAIGSWFTTAGGLGTYVFARTDNTLFGEVTTFGSLAAGSQLQPTSAISGAAGSPSVVSHNAALGPALAGTWRCMGYYDRAIPSDSGGNFLGATLWVRVL